MANGIDVVVVPDFSGDKCATFEARTLFFLASWIENAGRARHFPLHLACIGEPPFSVRWLAERAHASITVHEPLKIEQRGSANKLRGLEIVGVTDRVLLLDVDVLVLGDISDLTAITYGIAASPARRPRIPERYWKKIYPALGMELPSERIASIRGELACPVVKRLAYPEEPYEFGMMLPYYNTGVVLAPWGCNLRRLWEEHIRGISTLFHGSDRIWRAADASDAGFATSVEFLKRRGLPFARLGDAFHGSRLHLYRRALRASEIKLFHASGCFGNAGELKRLFEDVVNDYRRVLFWDIVNEWWRQDGRNLQAASIVQCLLPAAKDAYGLGRFLLKLYKCHVAAAFAQTSTS